MGPAFVMAVRGKWLVAGFAYGGIVGLLFFRMSMTILALERNVALQMAVCVSCSSLPSDEWFCPVLEADGDDDETSQEPSLWGLYIVSFTLTSSYYTE